MNKLIAVIILSSSLMGMDISIVERERHSITVEVSIANPQISHYEIGDRSLNLPRWSDAAFSYHPQLEKIVPVFTIPILLPPDGVLPQIEILQSQLSPDQRLPRQIHRNTFAPDMELPLIESEQMITVMADEDFRSFNTARILIMPYAEKDQRLENITFRLTFPDNSPAGSSQDLDLISTYLNSDMASNWAKVAPASLNRLSQTLPSGQWYRFPINEMGIHRITANSFPGTIPSSNPASWQVYAPNYEGKSLSFELSNTAPLPDNLKAISVQTKGLEDGV
ncbi:MAG: hypothetical protein K9M55_10030, partial [Candidatus Marinimicrobia bacterium]|nr:hypothetical protein [Candidatus Neomarinimicrobiota bacterium]